MFVHVHLRDLEDGSSSRSLVWFSRRDSIAQVHRDLSVMLRKSSLAYEIRP